MNRVRLGIAVLLVLVLLSSASAWLVRSETSRLLNDLDQLRETAPAISRTRQSRHSSSSTTSGKSPNAASIWWCGGTRWCRST